MPKYKIKFRYLNSHLTGGSRFDFEHEVEAVDDSDAERQGRQIARAGRPAYVVETNQIEEEIDYGDDDRFRMQRGCGCELTIKKMGDLENGEVKLMLEKPLQEHMAIILTAADQQAMRQWLEFITLGRK